MALAHSKPFRFLTKWQPHQSTLYILALVFVTLSILAIRNYRNSILDRSTHDRDARKEAEGCFNRHTSTIEHSKRESSVKLAIPPPKESSPEPSWKPSQCEPGSQILVHHDTTTQRNMFSYHNLPIPQGSRIYRTSSLTDVMLVSSANPQYSLVLSAEPPFQSSKWVQEQKSGEYSSKVGHPQLQKKTVQVFQGVGIGEGRVWKRKILEYR